MIQAEVIWKRRGESFLDHRYSRAHVWSLDGGIEVPASSSPDVVPVPLSVAEAVDPEEAFVASLSSCHMLWFLSIAAKKGWVVDEYIDQATATMGKNEDGRIAISVVTLRPEIQFAAAKVPNAEEIEAMHHVAHEKCFIANSVRAEIRCLPVTPASS